MSYPQGCVPAHLTHVFMFTDISEPIQTWVMPHYSNMEPHTTSVAIHSPQETIYEK